MSTNVYKVYNNALQKTSAFKTKKKRRRRRRQWRQGNYRDAKKPAPLFCFTLFATKGRKRGRLNLASRRKMHKWILVFKCSNYLVPKYLTQYFRRNADLHNQATRRSNDLHPLKPKCNMAIRTFKYAGSLYFNYLPNYVKSATSVNSFKKMLTEYFTS